MVVAILDHRTIGMMGQHCLEVTQDGCLHSPGASIGQGDRYRHAWFDLGINLGNYP
jgi:hypothetical protein